MDAMKKETCDKYDEIQSSNVGARRTYVEIASILAEREGSPISSERVRQICQEAHTKIARALLADAEFRDSTRYSIEQLRKRLE